MEMVTTKEYLGTVESIHMNEEYACILAEHRVQLHSIENEKEIAKLFPEKDDEILITAAALTKEFLIYGTSKGSIFYFYLGDWAFVNEFVIFLCE